MSSAQLPLAKDFNIDLGKHKKVVAVTTHADKVAGTGRESVYWCYLCQTRVNPDINTWGSKRYVAPSTEGIKAAWIHALGHFNRDEIHVLLARICILGGDNQWMRDYLEGKLKPAKPRRQEQKVKVTKRGYR